MKKGLMILAHGSKVDETDQIMTKYLEAVSDSVGYDQVEKAYLQMMLPSVEMAFKKFHDMNVTELTILPFFIFNGNHIKIDIPEKLEEMTKLYPKVTIRLLENIGFDKKMADLIIERVAI
jgi:sirohydrochlorin cobaltochelatase